MFFLTLRAHTVRPEAEEILERGEGHEYTIEETVQEEEDEELVVVKGDTVVDPGTVVVHLQYTEATH